VSELKVGDRIQLEGTVRRVRRESRLNEEFGLAWVDVHFRGDTWEDVNKITPEALGCATRIEPEGEAAITGVPVEKKEELDLSKPMQFKYYPDRKIKAVYGPTSINTYMVEEEKGVINMYMGEVLENIPEPKKTVMQEVNLHEYANGRRFFAYGYVSCAPLISKARITHTSGEGWRIEEFK